jgi:bifunctional non-homologous end joining protein LigD
MPYPKPKAPEGGVKAAFPGFVTPALASSIGKVPSGDRWIHEVKFDGYRVQLHIANEGIHIYTRRGHDWTDRFKKIATDAWHLKTKSASMVKSLSRPRTARRTSLSCRKCWGA